MKCEICPRACNINRDKQKGFCNQTNKVRISKVMFHHYEEPVISGAENQKGKCERNTKSTHLPSIWRRCPEANQRRSGRDANLLLQSA